MKPGKLWTPVLSRSVHNIINFKSSKSAAKLCIGEDAADFISKSSNILVSSAVREGNDPKLAYYGVQNAVNNIYAMHGIPSSIIITINLKKDEEESTLKQWIRNIDCLCRDMSLRVLGGHTSVSADNNSSVISVTAFGEKRNAAALYSKPYDNNFDGFHIIMTKYTGLEGTDLLLDKYYNELAKVYSSDFLHSINNFQDYQSISYESDIIWDYIDKSGTDDRKNKTSIPIFHDISEGGILAALWELSEYLSCGFEIDMKKILIKQLTIEVCEFLNINPYMLKTCGSLLIVTDKAEEIIERLLDNGISAADIGRITLNNDKILINKDEIKYIEPFRGDSIYDAKIKVR